MERRGSKSKFLRFDIIKTKNLPRPLNFNYRNSRNTGKIVFLSGRVLVKIMKF